ncbi:regulatory LuxR family protein [Streptomyces sp. BK022]|uniref:LuxR C-terminal-related transcriptional regulator n=1 Tax=Streptomyces sp. BK022 TaxID=2512123 RepID=UPI001028FF03|nr:LuxR C-terminal-related transcriptional regulator [Streptomyces sp. BK022]RZU36641.1 regulatory LuxR family protein [Streptomyces sp. BK022]
MLQILGLSQRSEAVYLAMLRCPDHGVAALASDTGLAETTVREALDELASLKLLKPSAQEAGALRPVSPTVGLTALLANAEAQAAAQRARVDSTRAAIASIAAEHDHPYDHDRALRLEGLDAVRARLEELQRTTAFECLSLNPGGAHRPDARRAATPLNEEALRRGVTIRAVCRESLHNDADTLAYARWLTGHGGQMRTVPTVPIQMIVLDREVAIVPLDPANHRAGALEIRTPGTVSALCALFEQVWEHGTPFGEQPLTDLHGCTPTERTLLQIIAAGDTDETAARQLGVSLRTVRRMMSSLMERLDATSRFQAGLNAAKRGWL